MKKTAAEIGLKPTPYKGRTVSFPDYHGRPVTGTLADAHHRPGAAYATITTTDGRSRSVFANTDVEIA